MRLALTKAAQRVAALGARAGRERGRVQEEVLLAVLVKVVHEELLHIGQRPRLARVAREARVGAREQAALRRGVLVFLEPPTRQRRGQTIADAGIQR